MRASGLQGRETAEENDDHCSPPSPKLHSRTHQSRAVIIKDTKAASSRAAFTVAWSAPGRHSCQPGPRATLETNNGMFVPNAKSRQRKTYTMTSGRGEGRQTFDQENAPADTGRLLTMWKERHGLWRAVAVAAVAAVTIWLVYAVWRSPHRDDLSTFGSFAAALAVIAAGVMGRAWRRRSARAAAAGPNELDRLTDLLALAVRDQWTRAAAERRLLEPQPIPVRWRKATLPLVGPASAAVASQRFPPLPGMAAIGLRQLQAGRIGDLHALYAGLGSGRLVIAGSAGAGKSAAAVLLVLTALKHRADVPENDRPHVPVPVMFTMHGWDPNTQRLEDWLISRIVLAYPLLAATSAVGAVSELVRKDKIALILDGLDEISTNLRPVALRALSEQAAFRLVLLTRSDEMAIAAQRGLLTGAVAVELQDVEPPVAADYLTRVQLDPPPIGWSELTRRLRRLPDNALTRALSSPLTLTLVRDIYGSGDDVCDLLNFCDGVGTGASREDIEDHLLDRVLPAAYASRPGEASPRYDLQTAQRALSCIATRMNKDGSRDLAWWRIPTWVTPVPRVTLTGLIVSFVAGLGFGLEFRVIIGLVMGLMIGLILGPGFGIGGRRPNRIVRFSWQQLFKRSHREIGFRLRLMAAAGFGFGFVFGLGLGLGVGLGLVLGLVIGLVIGLVAVLTMALGFRIYPSRADHVSPLSPLASWRGDRAFGIFCFAAWLVFCLGIWLVASLVGLAFGQPFKMAGAFVFVFVFGFVIGLAGGLLYSKTWPTSLAFAQLAVQWRSPVRLMRFLEDARGRNVLRTVGPFYEFRHARLQDRLAYQASMRHRAEMELAAGHSRSSLVKWHLRRRSRPVPR
jgi:hypothetical protein